MPNVEVKPDDIDVDATLTVIDFMFDESDPGFYARDTISAVTGKCCRSLLIAGSTDVPSGLRVDAVVGHLLRADEGGNPPIYGGLAYAPVSMREPSSDADNSHTEELRSILLAFGNWHNAIAFEKTLSALREIDYAGEVIALLPSGLKKLRPELECKARGLKVRFESNVPSVIDLIRASDLVIGGYGNLTYETLAVGRPFIVIGVKDFMIEYGQRLAAWDCLRCFGHVGKVTPQQIGQAIHSYRYEERKLHAQNGPKLVDGRGFERLAKLIKSEYQLALTA